MEEVVISNKFLIEIYKEATSLWLFFAIFTDGSSQSPSQCNILETPLLS